MIPFFDLSVGLVGIFISMCMYTTLYGKSNPLYSLAEESYLGFATGLVVILSFSYIYRIGIEGILAGEWYLAIGLLLGLMMFARISPEYSYLSRLPIGISVGVQLALSMRTTIFSGFIRHINATIIDLFPGDIQSLLYGWTIMLSLIPIMTFFLYSTEQTGVLKWSAKLGEYTLYIGLGAIFASGYMGRLGMFVGYMQGMTNPSWKIPYTLGIAVFVLASTIVMDRMGILEKYSD